MREKTIKKRNFFVNVLCTLFWIGACVTSKSGEKKNRSSEKSVKVKK